MKNKFWVLFFFISTFLFSQNNFYRWPLDSPRVITGNYGELRPNHFHAGIDFSTNGLINLPVYCIEDGYVSRIKISSVGYGRAVYITHPNGKVSLYGHLNSLNSFLSDIVKKEQYVKQSYEIEIYPPKNNMPIKKGTLVGLSGNSGGSTGPHLHFELRDEITEMPLNPLHFFKLNDVIPPEIKHVAFYNLSDTSSPKFLTSFHIKKLRNGSLVLANDSIVLKQSILGFAFSGFDQFVKNGNPNNIFKASVFLDEHLIYSHAMNGISFADARFVNEFSEAIQTKSEKLKFQKCFLPTVYPPNFFENCLNKGRIIFLDTNFHSIKLVVFDENGNEQFVKFWVKTKTLNAYSSPLIKSDVYVNCSKDFMMHKNKLQLFIPANTLYYSTGLIVENTIETTGKLIVLPSEVNLKSTSIVGFQVPKKLLKNKSKLVLRTGSSIINPTIKNDSVFYSIKNFGWFQLEQDTVAPKVKTKLKPKKIAKTKRFSEFSFDIKDKLSGIAKYHLFVNDKWVLAEYDSKSDLLTYHFDDETPSGNLAFKLEVEDRVGNKTIFKYLLKRR